MASFLPESPAKSGAHGPLRMLDHFTVSTWTPPYYTKMDVEDTFVLDMVALVGKFPDDNHGESRDILALYCGGLVMSQTRLPVTHYRLISSFQYGNVICLPVVRVC